MERVRTAGGGATLTALRSFEAIGTSATAGLSVTRLLKVMALFPLFYRQEETMPATMQDRGLQIAMGLDGNTGWINGAVLGGDGRSADRATAQRAYTRAARQAMAGFVAGVNAPWLMDSGRYTITDGGTIDAGIDKGAAVIILDGPDGRLGRLLVDPGTRLPRRLIQPPQPGSGGRTALADIVFTYSDYAPQGGLQLPHTIVRENGGDRTVWSISHYTLNPPLTPRHFNRRERR